jgi:hypothetical protein
MKAPDLPSHVSERATDCGGFVASFKWGKSGAKSRKYEDFLLLIAWYYFHRKKNPIDVPPSTGFRKLALIG